MITENINITKQGLWFSDTFSEYKNPVNDILSSAPTEEADKSRIYKDGHVEAAYFYELWELPFFANKK